MPVPLNWTTDSSRQEISFYNRKSVASAHLCQFLFKESFLGRNMPCLIIAHHNHLRQSYQLTKRHLPKVWSCNYQKNQSHRNMTVMIAAIGNFQLSTGRGFEPDGRSKTNTPLKCFRILLPPKEPKYSTDSFDLRS